MTPGSRCRWLSCLAVLALLLTAPAFSEETPEYELKVELIDRICRFVDWPPGAAASDPATPFTIAVIGKDPFGTYLDKLTSERRIKDKKIRIVRAQSLDEIRDCQLLFVSASEVKNLARILALTGERPILTVGDSKGYGEAGVVINFFTDKETIHFEINEPAADRGGFRISSKLRRLARMVGTESR